MWDLTSWQFWEENAEDYLFRSLWPGGGEVPRLFEAAGGIRETDRILEVCCGTGDLLWPFAQAAPQGQVYGLDRSRQVLQLAQQKLRNPRFLLQVMLWGRFFGLWQRGQVQEAEAQELTVELGLEGRSFHWEAVREKYLQAMAYITWSPYPALLKILASEGLFQPERETHYRRLLDWFRRRDDLGVVGSIVGLEATLTDARTCLQWAEMDALQVAFPAETFDRVFSVETALLLSRQGDRWLDEMVRVCRPGGAILYLGVRLRSPRQAERSEEIKMVCAALEGHPGLELVERETCPLQSPWDPLFNSTEIITHVYTPYLLFKRHL